MAMARSRQGGDKGEAILLFFVTSVLRIARAMRMESNACSANWSRMGGGGATRIPPTIGEE